MVVDPRAEERELAGRCGRSSRRAPRGARRAPARRARARGRARGRSARPRDVGEQLVDRLDADRREHLLAVALGSERKLTARRRSSRRPAASIRSSASQASVRRMRTSQPSPYGSSFTVSGSSTTFWLTSTTTPESGAIRSETAFTDSTSPYEDALRDLGALLGRLEVDELAERVLREPGDAERRLVALDARPVVLGVVLQLVRDSSRQRPLLSSFL